MVYAMPDQQVNVLKHLVEKLAKEAGFKETPVLEISNDKHLRAKASIFRKKITVGAELLTQWQNGEIDESDVEVTLAHETGHLIDFDRKFHSVLFSRNVVVVLYLILGAVLLKGGSYLSTVEPWVLFALLSAIWAVPFLWILRASACAVQLEADKNGARLITEEKFANSLAKRMRFHNAGLGPIETWELLLHVVLFPSLSERLRNLKFEIKESKIEIQRMRGC